MFEEPERPLYGFEKTYRYLYDSFWSKQFSNYKFTKFVILNKSWSESGSGLDPYSAPGWIQIQILQNTWIRIQWIRNRNTGAVFACYWILVTRFLKTKIQKQIKRSKCAFQTQKHNHSKKVETCLLHLLQKKFSSVNFSVTFRCENNLPVRNLHLSCHQLRYTTGTSKSKSLMLLDFQQDRKFRSKALVFILDFDLNMELNLFKKILGTVFSFNTKTAKKVRSILWNDNFRSFCTQRWDISD